MGVICSEMLTYRHIDIHDCVVEERCTRALYAIRILCCTCCTSIVSTVRVNNPGPWTFGPAFILFFYFFNFFYLFYLRSSAYRRFCVLVHISPKYTAI